MSLATLRYPRGGRGRLRNRPPPRPPEEPTSGRTHHHRHHHHSAPSPVPTTSARHPTPLLFVPQLVGVASLVSSLLLPRSRPSTAPLDSFIWSARSAISKEPWRSRRLQGRETPRRTDGVGRPRTHRERGHERAIAFGLEGRSRPGTRS